MEMIYRNAGGLLAEQKTVTLGPQATVQEAAERMAAYRIGAILVVASGALVGLFTERDLLNRVVAKRLRPEDLRLEDVMTPDPITVDADTSLVRSLSTMFEHGFRHLPVLQNGQVVGVLSCRDVPPDYWLLRENWLFAQAELGRASA